MVKTYIATYSEGDRLKIKRHQERLISFDYEEIPTCLGDCQSQSTKPKVPEATDATTEVRMVQELRYPYHLCKVYPIPSPYGRIDRQGTQDGVPKLYRDGTALGL